MWIDFMNQVLEGNNFASSSQVIAAPDEETTKDSMPISRRVIVPGKFEKDIKALRAFVGESAFIPGAILNFTLQELLTICYRKRRKIDAFKALVRYLNTEFNIKLNIKSQKTKKL